jgi:hypothetical protein
MGYFIKKFFLKAMEEIHKLRGQITNILQVNCPGVDVYLDSKMKPPSTIQVGFVQFYFVLL